MAKLGVEPHDCVVIEDSVAGIAAGRAAGCLVVAVRAGNFGGWDQSGAHRVIDTLEAFPSLLDELASIDPRDYGSSVP
jgi:sugar-phosphatase